MDLRFFILGNPRSGTTLLRLMLDSHPNITVPPEFGFGVWLKSLYSNWDSQSSITSKLEAFIADLSNSKKVENWNLDFNKLLIYLKDVKPPSYAQLVNAVYQFYVKSLGRNSEYIGDKNNYYLNHILDLIELYPNAKFIHIIRDGRDVACSYRELTKKQLQSAVAPKLPTAIRDIATEWLNNNLKIEHDLQKFVSENNSILVRYEDLVVNPKLVLSDICEFLQLRFSNSMLEYHTNLETKEPDEYKNWKGNVTKPLMDNSINRYVTELSPSDLQEFEDLAGNMLSKYKYLK